MLTKKPKPYPDLVSEVSLGFFISGPDRKIIIGVDEVGRGCLAGSVVAAAAVLDPERVLKLGFLKSGKRGKAFAQNPAKDEHPIRRLQDSKLISEDQRPLFSHAVRDFVLGCEIAEASVDEIGDLNILYASHLAMERSVRQLEKKLGIKADIILIDGNMVPKALKDRGVPLIKGDQKSLTIACASIVAKVYRDELMNEMEAQYPGYGMKAHKGYPTPYHKKQIERLGPTPIHRRGFKGSGV